MRRLLPLFSLLVLAVWLPVTEHCALEATGLIPKTCTDESTPGRPCKDGCDTVESGLYKPSADTLKILPADLLARGCHFCLQLIPLDAAREIAPVSGASFELPQDWVSTWHFVRRAAPSPRAPSALSA